MRLESEIGSGAEVIGEIVPELRSKLPDLGAPPTFDPDSARFRLFDSITTYLKNVSATKPLVLILEDLHWADASSLALLEHVADYITASNLLIIGTYRDIEAPFNHPLTRPVGSLVRHQGFHSLQLGGLTHDEVGHMITSSVGADAPPDMVENVHRRTEGNALFIVELLELLVSGVVDGTQEWQSAIPEGIRGVISRRFEGLSDKCNQALTVASVIGREFDFDLLSQISGSPDDDLLNIVDEAVEAHVIEDMRGSIERYRFTHALIEQTLYERQTSSRRSRLHSRIGETLEDVYANDVESHASELVRHFSRSPRRQDSEKVLHYGKLAANHATSVYAYREATDYLEQCLDVQKALDPDDDESRLDLLIELGEGLIVAGEPQRAFADIAPEAFAMAEARDDSGQAFQSSRIAIHALHAFGSLTGSSMPEYREWAKRADRHAEPETTERIEADLAMASTNYIRHEFQETWRLYHRALRLASQLDEPEYIARCNWLVMGWTWPPGYQKELFDIARESADAPVPTVTPLMRGDFLNVVVHCLLRSGDGDRAWRMHDEFLTIIERTQIPSLRTKALSRDISIKTYEGDLESAVEAIDQLIVGSEELGSAAFGLQHAAFRGIIPLLYLGRAEEALALIPQARRYVGLEAEPLSPNLPPSNLAEYALCLAHTGRLTEAQEYFSLVMERVEGRLSRRQVSAITLDQLLETAVILKDVDVARALAEQLEDVAGGEGSARHLGEAASLSREPARALEYFHEALDISINMPDRPEVALTRFDLAELFLDSYPDQRIEGLEHLDFAIAEFKAMKMQPSLDRAHALKDWAEGAPIPTPPLPDGLTPREVQVLRLIAKGGSNRGIANELNLSVRTVERHTTNIYRKIDAHGRADAIAYALRLDMDDST